MTKSENEIFDIPESDKKVTIQVEEKKPKKKSRKPLGDEEKAALIQRLKEGRERKKREREQNKEKPAAAAPSQPAAKTRPDSPIPKPVVERRNDLSEEIKLLREQIKSTRERQEILELRSELKELKAQQKKLDNNNRPENVRPQKINPPTRPNPTDSHAQRQVSPPPQPKVPPKPQPPKILKKRYR